MLNTFNWRSCRMTRHLDTTCFVYHPPLYRARRTSLGRSPGRSPVRPRRADWTQHRSLTTLRTKLIKIGAKVVRHARSVTFQLAEVAVPRGLFRTILQRIHRLALPPPEAVS